MTTPQDNRSAHQQQRFIEIENVGAHQIPPFGVCEVVESQRPESATQQTPGGGRTVLQVKRPTADGLCNVVVNGPLAVAPGASCAIATNDYPTVALWAVSGAESPPVSGQIWGTVKDQFHLGPGRQGFAVAGDADAATSTVRVFRAERLHRLEITGETPLEPGGQALARVLRYQYKTQQWIATGTTMASLIDPLCRAFALPGEKIWAECYGDAYQTVGEFGLRRRAKLFDPVLQPGQVGTVEVLWNDYQEACSAPGVWFLQACYSDTHKQVLFRGNEFEILYHPGLKRWHIIAPGGGSPIIRFRMETVLPLGGKGTAIEVGTGPAYVPIGVPFPIKDGTVDPGRFRDDYAGYIGYCYVPDNPEFDAFGNPYREILHMEQIARSITFTALADMVPVRKAPNPPTGTRFDEQKVLAEINEYYLGKDPRAVFGPEVVVFDPQGQFPRVLEGAQGKARYNDREHRYEIVVCDQQADRIAVRFLKLCGDEIEVSDSERAVEIWSFPPYGQMPRAAGDLPDPNDWIANTFNLGLCDGGQALLVWNEDAGKYVVAQVGHVDETVVNGIRLDGCTIELKHKDIKVMVCAPNSGWGCDSEVKPGCGGTTSADEMCIELAEFNVLTDVTLSDATPTGSVGSGTCKITGSVRTICGFDTGGGASPVDLVSFSPVSVMQDWYLDGLNIKADLVTVYSPCQDPGGAVVLETGVDCDTVTG